MSPAYEPPKARPSSGSDSSSLAPSSTDVPSSEVKEPSTDSNPSLSILSPRIVGDGVVGDIGQQAKSASIYDFTGGYNLFRMNFQRAGRDLMIPGDPNKGERPRLLIDLRVDKSGDHEQQSISEEEEWVDAHRSLSEGPTKPIELFQRPFEKPRGEKLQEAKVPKEIRALEPSPRANEHYRLEAQRTIQRRDFPYQEYSAPHNATYTPPEESEEPKEPFHFGMPIWMWLLGVAYLVVCFFLPRLVVRDYMYPFFDVVVMNLHPAYTAYTCLHSSAKQISKHQLDWPMYVVVLIVFQIVQNLLDRIFFWLPLYYETKIMFGMWLISAHGVRWAYKHALEPIIKSAEVKVRKCFSKWPLWV